MRFVVQTDNDKYWLKKLHPFDTKLDNHGLTVDLNSWHAFSELEKAFGYVPKVLVPQTYPQFGLPVINFAKNCG